VPPYAGSAALLEHDAAALQAHRAPVVRAGDPVRVFSVKKTSLSWTVVPVVVVLIGLVLVLVGLVGAVMGENWAPILILIGTGAAFVMTMGLVTVVRRSKSTRTGRFDSNPFGGSQPVSLKRWGLSRRACLHQTATGHSESRLRLVW
jgi:predicted lysophospholipase L1 biosynthesis ABC-type transport system permease subunit